MMKCLITERAGISRLPRTSQGIHQSLGPRCRVRPSWLSVCTLCVDLCVRACGQEVVLDDANGIKGLLCISTYVFLHVLDNFSSSLSSKVPTPEGKEAVRRNEKQQRCLLPTFISFLLPQKPCWSAPSNHLVCEVLRTDLSAQIFWLFDFGDNSDFTR